MGGPGSGGARPNSGPPPKSLAEKVLAGTATLAERRAFVVEQEGGKRAAAGQVVPAHMPRDARKVWDRLAPHALAAHTLTPATVDSFRQLCELTVKRDRVGQRIDREGWTVRVALNARRPAKPHQRRVRHPLLSEYARLRHEVLVLLTRFRLAPLGRAMEYVEPVAVDPATDEFGEFEAPIDDDPPPPPATSH